MNPIAPLTLPMSLAALHAMCESSPFIRFAGIKVMEVDAATQRSRWRMPWRPEFERAQGTGQWQGGSIAALIDTAGCMGLIAIIGKYAGTVDFRTDYLRPASGEYLDAIALVRRAGRTLGVVDIDVLDSSARLVATGRGSFFVEQSK
jgi:uncharacterized protein (TIGR00369 family)